MNRIARITPWLLALVLMSVQAATAWADQSIGVYVNHKYRYEIAYPADRFVSQGESPSGDGQRFVAPDGRAELLVYAHYNVLDQTLADSYREAQATAGRRTTYKVMKADWFVVSGYEGGRIFYRKTLLRNGTFFTFELHYDPADRALYDPLVPRIAADFRIE